jgi:anti-anti-sigma factor
MKADPTSLEIEVEIRAVDGGREIAFLRPRGEIDLANSDQLAAALTAPAAARSDGIVLDLSRVSFMDSSGLRVSLTAAKERGDAFATIVEQGSAVGSLVELVDVGERLNVVADEAEALARLGATRPE